MITTLITHSSCLEIGKCLSIKYVRMLAAGFELTVGRPLWQELGALNLRSNLGQCGRSEPETHQQQQVSAATTIKLHTTKSNQHHHHRSSLGGTFIVGFIS